MPEGQEKTESAGVPKRPAEAEKTIEEPKLEKGDRATKNVEPATRSRVVEGIQSSCNNPQKEMDG